MTANDLFGHIRSVGKEREEVLREEHEAQVVQIERDRLKAFEDLKVSLEKDLDLEKASMIERHGREETRKTRAEVSVLKNRIFDQMKRKTEKMVLDMEIDSLAEIFAARLRPIKSRLVDDAKLISSERWVPLAREVFKRAGIDCPVEAGNIPDGELILEDRGMTVELSIGEIIDDEAQKNSAKLYEMIFD